eukprot:TRINITY_DN4218_c2_g2_i1.p1 TRINITY_DN4218_c2_g2~~TRINITY_DN4218_c2_g2_i1.p1  ORF type:complete len:536 (-),score=80.08 TRINITY_DN4218_c2_g2_i1:22-1629(-)
MNGVGKETGALPKVVKRVSISTDTDGQLSARSNSRQIAADTDATAAQVAKAPASVAISPCRGEVKSTGNHVSVEILRRELTRFGKHNLKMELTGFREALKGDVTECVETFAKTSLTEVVQAVMRETVGSRTNPSAPSDAPSWLVPREDTDRSCAVSRAGSCLSGGNVSRTASARMFERKSFFVRSTGSAINEEDVDDVVVARRGLGLGTHDFGSNEELDDLEGDGDAEFSGTILTPSTDVQHLPLLGDGDRQEDHTDVSLLLRYVVPFVQSEFFDWIVGVFIVINSIMLGVQADYMARKWISEVPGSFALFNMCAAIIFVVELLLRAACYGETFKQYVIRNIFDVLVIVTVAVSALMDLHDFIAGTPSVLSTRGVGALRIMRLLRIIRILRLPRLLHAIGELRVLVASLLDSLRPLVWTVILIVLVTYMFAVYLTQLVTDHKVNNRYLVKTEQKQLEDFFGNLPRTSLTLYEAVSDGMSWGYFAEPLILSCSWWYGFCFIIYVTFCVLGMMNVVMSVFVTGAIKHAEEDKQKVLM